MKILSPLTHQSMNEWINQSNTKNHHRNSPWHVLFLIFFSLNWLLYLINLFIMFIQFHLIYLFMLEVVIVSLSLLKHNCSKKPEIIITWSFLCNSSQNSFKMQFGCYVSCCTKCESYCFNNILRLTKSVLPQVIFCTLSMLLTWQAIKKKNKKKTLHKYNITNP